MIDDPDALRELALDAELAASEQLLDESFRSTLGQLLSTPEGLANRTTAQVGDALLTRSTLATAVDLFTVGWHTFRLLAGDNLSDPPQEPHR
jgi:hypothetical protein